MTVQQAFAELGVEAGADVETIRRAYLRLIKERKPEQDPEGFKRAREAFEIARSSSEMEELVAASAAPEVTPPPAPAAPGAHPPPRTDPFLPYLEAWKAVPAAADMRQRLKIATDAREALPHDPRAYWLVASTLDGRAIDLDLAEALRAGWRQGWPEFLEALLVRVPGRAARVEVDAALDSPRTSLRLLGAMVAARWDAPRAASVVVETCEQILSVPPGGPPQGVPVERLMHVVLILHELRAVAEAQRAHAALRRCLQETGLELRLMSGPLGGLWILAEEIAGLPPDFPPALRTAFATAARSGDMRSAFFDACFHVRHGKREVRRWVKRLGTQAPNVVNTLREALRREASKKVSFNLSGLRWYFFIWPALLFFRMVANDGCSPSSDHASRRATYTAPAPEAAPAGSDPRLSMVHAAAGALCGPTGPRYGEFVCADIETALAALEQGDCSEIPARVRAINHKLYDGSIRDLDVRFTRNLELAVWQICPKREQPEPGK